MEMIRFEVGTYLRPCDGEAVSGDAIVVKELEGGQFLCLIDVVGHGREAAEVALQAIRFLKQQASPDIAEVLTRLHEHLRGTRGAVVAVCYADHANGSVICAGIGNSILRRLGQHEQICFFPDGIVGVRFRTPRITSLSLENGELLLMYTDGVTENFPQPDIGSLFGMDVNVIARRVVLNHGKRYDDAACIALRRQRRGDQRTPPNA